MLTSLMKTERCRDADDLDALEAGQLEQMPVTRKAASGSGLGQVLTFAYPSS